MTSRLKLAALLVGALLVLVPVACGGDDAPEVGDVGDAAGELERQAEEVEQIVSEEVEGLGDVRSLDDLSADLEDAQARLEEQADEIEATEVEENLEDDREELESATRDLAAELEEVRDNVDEEDLTGALEELGDLEAVDAVEQAIEDIRNAE